MNVVIDTSIWVEYFAARNPPICDQVDDFLKHGLVLMTPVVAAELISGVRPEKKQNELDYFLRKLPLAKSDFDHWLRVGKTRAHLLSYGFSVSTPDAHVCQAALDTGASLYSRDGIFEKIAKKLRLRLVSA